VVMGEFPLDTLNGKSYGEVVQTWFSGGYAGALGWQYNEASPEDLGRVRSFAEAHPCETRY